MRNRSGAGLIALVVAANPPSPADAAEWKIDPRIELRSGYNDNISLRTDDELSSPEIIVKPATLFSYETPTSGISGDLGFQVRRYTEESDLNDEIGRLDVKSFHRMENTELGFNFDLIKDTTLDDQLEQTGVALDRVDRWRVDLNPTWGYAFSERSSMQLGYTYTNVDYDNDENSNFFNYTTNLGTFSLSRILSERATGSVIFQYGSSDNDADVESTYAGVSGGADYRFSETLTGSVFAGIRRTESKATRNTFVPVQDENNNIIFVPVSSGTREDDYGYIFSGSLSKAFLRGNTSFSATRDISNDISGFLLQVTQLRWASLYRFSETLSGQLDLSYYQSETANGVGRNRDNEYYWVEPRLNWRFRQFWTLSGSYRYSKQTYDRSNNDAVQNAAYLTLRYDWPRLSISR